MAAGLQPLPSEVLEAAVVDGAGHLRRLWSVVLPMSRPALATVALLLIEAKWNEFLWPLVATSVQEMRTLPVGIAFLISQEGSVDWHIVMAGAMFVVAPVIVVFLLVQRQLVASITAGAVIRMREQRSMPSTTSIVSWCDLGC